MLTQAKGNNNGFIDYNDIYADGYPQPPLASNRIGGQRFDGEIANFYVELGQMGFGSANYVADIPASGFNSVASAPNTPTVSAPKGKAELIPAPCLSSSNTQYNNCYLLGDFSKLGTTTDPNPVHYGAYLHQNPGVFSPEQALALDSKIDDGNPLSGTVNAFDPGSPIGARCLSVATPQTYDFTGNLCFLTIDMLSQVPNN